MMVKKFYRAGDMVQVRAIVPPCYKLPSGLPDGATVTVIRTHVGYDDVEYQGRIFTVPMVLIDSGYLNVPDAGTITERPD
jgi:hypothetical protein